MTSGSSHPVPARAAEPPRWFHWGILCVLLGIGGLIRFDRLGHESFWPDEFWGANYLATGRGNEVFDLPVGVLLDPPPHMGLAGAPSWPHIWTGLKSAVHPPLYSILMRWWMDVFGERDVPTRAFSVVMSLIGVLLLFDTVRQTSGPTTGLVAAAMMTLAVSQIDQSQEARPYTLLALLGLLACRALLDVERFGATAGRLLILAIAVMATALTHYFAVGALVGLGAYSLVRLRGGMRKKVVTTLIAAAALTCVIWFPYFWQQHAELFTQQEWSYDKKATVPLTILRAIFVPAMHLYGRLEWGLVISIAVLVYALPLILIRRRPHLLIWWFWLAGTVASLMIYDARSHSWLLGLPKYSFILTPALYALLAEPLPSPGWRGWAIPGMIVASLAIFANEKRHEGPLAKEDWRSVALAANRAGPRDPLIFYPSPFWNSPGFWYLDFDHYVPDSNRPVMMLNHPADKTALMQVSKYPRVWLVGPYPIQDAAKMLPGWKGVWVREYPGAGGVEEMVQQSATTSPAQSREARP